LEKNASEFQLLIAGATSNEIDDHLEQVIHPSLLFIFSGLKLVIKPYFLSYLGRNFKNEVYVGYNLSGHIYAYLYPTILKRKHHVRIPIVTTLVEYMFRDY
jgi:hypothetical protein